MRIGITGYEFSIQLIGVTGIDCIGYTHQHCCGGKGHAIKEPNEVKSIMHQAMKERKPTVIEAYVDPFEPPMPPKVEMEYVKELAKSFAKGQPYAKRIALTLYRDQVHNVLKNIHKHSD